MASSGISGKENLADDIRPVGGSRQRPGRPETMASSKIYEKHTVFWKMQEIIGCYLMLIDFIRKGAKIIVFLSKIIEFLVFPDKIQSKSNKIK